MDMEKLRDWLIQNGIPAEELDETVEPAALADLGKTLKTTLENDNQLGLLVTSFFMQFNDIAGIVMQQQIQIAQLEAEVQSLKGGN